MTRTSWICCGEGAFFVPDTLPIVFVVDDDISVRESLEFLIQDEGWHVATFTSAEEFLNRPREFIPKLLGPRYFDAGLEWAGTTEATLGGTA